MNCPKCNSPLIPEATVCSVCGTPVQQQFQQSGAMPPQGIYQQQVGTVPQQGNYLSFGTTLQQAFQQQPGFGEYTQPNSCGMSPQGSQGYTQPSYGTPLSAPQKVTPIFLPKKLNHFRKLGWFLGDIGLHDYYVGYMERGFLHAVFTKVALLSFLLALLISEASDITIYEDKYSYYQSLHSDPATASEIFCAIFLFFSFIIFVGNIIWTIIETVTVKKDSNGITMI